jgi:uncharacterized membrane protein
MDGLFYLVSLVVAIIGAFTFWRYSKTKKRALTRIIRNQDENKEGK